MTTFLKFADEQEAIEQLSQFRNDDGWITHVGDTDIDVIGTINKPTGETITDEEGNTVPVFAPLDGFHVNLVGELPESLNQFVVQPTNPMRVFA